MLSVILSNYYCTLLYFALSRQQTLLQSYCGRSSEYFPISVYETVQEWLDRESQSTTKATNASVELGPRDSKKRSRAIPQMFPLGSRLHPMRCSATTRCISDIPLNAIMHPSATRSARTIANSRLTHNTSIVVDDEAIHISTRSKIIGILYWHVDVSNSFSFFFLIISFHVTKNKIV